MQSRHVAAAAFLAAAVAFGCHKAPPPMVDATGVVLLNGKPLPKAKVRFIPKFEASNAFCSQGVTDDDGRFVLKCNGVPGACAAESIVMVSEDDIPEHLTPESARPQLQVYLKSLKNRPIPTQYSDLTNTPLTVTVSADQKEYKIELSR
jgi:hypothetical protein